MIVAIGESWVVNVLGLVDANAWDRTANESRTAGITLFAAYVLWEIFKYGTESYLHRHTTGDATSTATRLHTLIPLLRITVAIVLTVGGVLTVLLDSFENPWGGSLIRVGTVLAMLWFALPTSQRPAAWTGMSPWITVVIVGIGIFAARRPWLFFPLAGTIIFATLVLKPRRRREPERYRGGAS